MSYNRPFDTRDHDKSSWLFNAEYPMVRWLEANGYDVKYWSGVDTDRLGGDRHRPASPSSRRRSCRSATTSTGRAQQRTNVETARNGGVNLAFFSGNEMFWKTRYEPSIDGSNTAYRTLVSYKETLRDRQRPRSIRSRRIPGPARGAIRASARRSTAAGRRTR